MPEGSPLSLRSAHSPQCLAHLTQHALPISGDGLAEEPETGVPRGCGTSHPPEPRRHERQQHPAWNAQSTGNVSCGVVDGDDQIHRRHQGRKAVQIAGRINAGFVKKTRKAPFLVVNTILQADEARPSCRQTWSESPCELLQTKRALFTGNRAPREANAQPGIAVACPQGGDPLRISDQVRLLAGKGLRGASQIARQITGRDLCHTVVHWCSHHIGRRPGSFRHHLGSRQRAPQQGDEAGVARETAGDAGLDQVRDKTGKQDFIPDPWLPHHQQSPSRYGSPRPARQPIPHPWRRTGLPAGCQIIPSAGHLAQQKPSNSPVHLQPGIVRLNLQGPVVQGNPTLWPTLIHLCIDNKRIALD